MTPRHEILVKFGNPVRALERDGDLVTIGGLGVLYDDPANPIRDLYGDYFTDESYYGNHKGNGMDVMLHHGFPLGFSKQFVDRADTLFTPAKAEGQDDGLFVSTVLDLRKEYEAELYELAEQKALSWSSGAIGHGVHRTDDGWLKRWIIGEWSLTPTPAEPRTAAIPLKSLLKAQQEDPDFTDAAAMMALLNLRSRIILSR